MNQEAYKKSIIAECKKRYDLNMACLKKNNKKLYNRIAHFEIKNIYRVSPNTDNKTYNIYIEPLKKNYYENKDSLYEVKRHMDGMNLRNARIAFFFGFGLGYEVLYFTQYLSKAQRNRSIIVIEKDIELFVNAMYTTDIRGFIENKNIYLIVGEAIDDMFPIFSEYFRNVNHITLIKAISPVYYPTSIEMYKDYYFESLKKFKDAALYALSFYGNSPDDSLLGEKNMFENLDEIIENPGIDLLYNKFKGKPAIVVASGPSLKKNLDQLKGLEDKALILSAESTFTILGMNGVKPHIVASLERTMRTKSVFEGFSKEDVKNTYLAACPVIPKEAYEVYEGPRLVVYRHFDHFKWLEIEKGMLDIKHSSANMAFKIAVALGCDPIILVGQDLAFSREDHSTHVGLHVKGSQQDRYYQDKKVMVMGNDGEPIETCTSWYKFLKAYDLDVEAYEGRCINATEGGAYIQGTEVMTLKEAVDTYIKESINPLDIIEANTKDFVESDKEAFYKKIDHKIVAAIEKLNVMADYCDEGIALINEHKDTLNGYINKPELTEEDKKHIETLFVEIAKPREAMQVQGDTFQLLVMHVVQPIYIKLDIDMNELGNKYEEIERGIADSCLYLTRWYDVIKRLLSEIQKILVAAQIDVKEKLQ